MIRYGATIALILTSIIASTNLRAAAVKKQLSVYTYDSFISKWGPGPQLKKDFEVFCDCQIRWVGASDSAGILARLALEGPSTKADIVIGIDQQLTGGKDVDSLFDDLELNVETKNLPEASLRHPKFLPFDFGYLAFMFNTKARDTSGKLFSKPDSMEALLTSPELRKAVLIQDPRTSAPGLGLLLWLRSIYGEKTNKKLAALREQTLSISRGWSEAYGFFTKGEAPLVLSYTTSEAYHRDVEKTDQYVALEFKEGHYTAVETAAIVKHSKNKDLSRQFLKFLLSDHSQATIASANWMYPVMPIKLGLPPSYANLAKPPNILKLSQSDISQNRSSWIKEWTSAFAK